MEYILVTGAGKKGIADASDLNLVVTKKLKEGFKLYGSPGLTIDPQARAAIYYQALIKE